MNPDALPPVPEPAEIIDAAPAFVDLALNLPGQAAAGKAAEIRAAAPKRGFFAKLFRPPPREHRPWEQGAAGERAVGQRLQRLPDTWRVLHAVPVGVDGSDIDHVVIGPGGVFTLTTKNHARGNVWVADKVFMVNGQKQPYYRNSRFEAKRAGRLLTRACGTPIPVEPVIVVLAKRYTHKGQPADVHVVKQRAIARWMTRRPVALQPEDIASIFDHARRPTTWGPPAE